MVFNSKDNKYDHLILQEDFGEQIKHLRESKGLNITGLAIRSGLSEDYLTKTEKNLTNPSRFFMHHLANAFQMDFDELINHLYTDNSSKVN
ncbi:helix-turn-helix domain-containing protein [Psychrobacillus soli]|uniref:helix-turn-helix domain-containing protein n=1 Tax=Psychrobacillus soli TaxID=1543965 RepID=UPI001FE45821|nr:helix-turn-helix transcriptional regulator [Psychrobacillus soli]